VNVYVTVVAAVPLVAAASATNDRARGPCVGGWNGAWVVSTCVQVVAVCVACCGRAVSRTGEPRLFTSVAVGICP
jgi:hypothetical protein